MTVWIQLNSLFILAVVGFMSIFIVMILSLNWGGTEAAVHGCSVEECC